MEKSCENCKNGEYDCIFDEQSGEEYPFWNCIKGCDISLDFECLHFEKK